MNKGNNAEMTSYQVRAFTFTLTILFPVMSEFFILQNINAGLGPGLELMPQGCVLSC